MTQGEQERELLLRRALKGNALFSGLSGVGILIANVELSRLLGWPSCIPLVIVAVALLGFAILLTINASRQSLSLADAWTAVWMDLAWVVGSYVLLFIAPFSKPGRWIVAIVAEVVLLFAIVQWLGIRKIGRAEIYS